ncbi:MAG: hypothetical protein HPY53_01070 [Brevinematales bacterium]|nr:hypothetical protein [Brevinematales bacterium]
MDINMNNQMFEFQLSRITGLKGVQLQVMISQVLAAFAYSFGMNDEALTLEKQSAQVKTIDFFRKNNYRAFSNN